MNWNPWMGPAAVVVACIFVSGCATQKITYPELVENSTITQSGEPSHITVQHILIGFEGTVDGKDIERNRVEAEELAIDLLIRAQSGEDFAKLVEEYTDDSPPGIYHLANNGEPSEMLSTEAMENVYPRHGMVAAFGDVGFPLEVGEIGLSKYDPDKSPYGWHIIKRLK